MALNVQFFKTFNRLIEEYIISTRLVNQQTLEYNKLCDYLADGSTVTATDVSAVMKQLEKKLPFLLGLNVKAICSPEGLTFRPAVSGSITQSQLKAKLVAKKAAETDPDKAEKIDVNRELETSDLTTSDIVASIAIDLPKKWLERFHAEAEFNRITKDSQGSSGQSTGDNGGDAEQTDGGQQTGGNTDSGNSGGNGGNSDNGDGME